MCPGALECYFILNEVQLHEKVHLQTDSRFLAGFGRSVQILSFVSELTCISLSGYIKWVIKNRQHLILTCQDQEDNCVDNFSPISLRPCCRNEALLKHPLTTSTTQD